MDELFNILSSSARIDKSKRPLKKKRRRDQNLATPTTTTAAATLTHHDVEPAVDDDSAFLHDKNDDNDNDNDPVVAVALKSRDRTGKRDTSAAKLAQVHREQVAAFRRAMNIQLAAHNKHDPHTPDPISSFAELSAPSWWKTEENDSGHSSSSHTSFAAIQRAVQHNVEAGRWKEPTPIQMQALPALLQARRDLIGAAPTGSGKSGAFLIPALFLASAPWEAFYGTTTTASSRQSKKNKKQNKPQPKSGKGEIRALVLAPSLELAAQLHREVERLGTGKPGGLASLLLSKANAAQVVDGTAGGKSGLDVLVATPLRLVDAIEKKGLRLNSVRLVVLDEADRLLDATDGGGNMEKVKKNKHKKQKQQQRKDGTNDDNSSSSDEEEENVATTAPSSGSTQSQTFLSQVDVILHQIPATAVRALFSATVTPMVRQLSESILRNPVDVTIAATSQGGANPDIEQKLTFVGREEGKLLAIRQLVARGQLHPPVIIFLQSQERAQALFGELLYDGIRVDVIHAGRSKAARESAVAKFRKGDTWVLICTDLVARGVDFRAVNMVINYDLPVSGVTYVHRIGRTGRAGRKGQAITLFTEADFENLRTIANVMKQSGCEVEDWMLNLPKKKKQQQPNKLVQRRRQTIDTTPSYDKKKRHKKKQMVKHSKEKKRKDSIGSSISSKREKR